MMHCDWLDVHLVRAADPPSEVGDVFVTATKTVSQPKQAYVRRHLFLHPPCWLVVAAVVWLTSLTRPVSWLFNFCFLVVNFL